MADIADKEHTITRAEYMRLREQEQPETRRQRGSLSKGHTQR